MALPGRCFLLEWLDSGDFPLPNGFPPPVSELPVVEVIEIEIERPQLPVVEVIEIEIEIEPR